MQYRFLPLLTTVFISACSTANVAINRNFDYTRVRRVAILGFKDYVRHSGSGDIVTGAFEQSLLNAGYDLVERDRISQVLAEQKFSGVMDPGTVKNIGQRLGVDALLFGQITDMDEPRSQMTKIDVVDDHSDPIYVHKTTRTQQPDGTWSESTQQVIEGYRTTHTIHREPRTYTISGRLGLSARLVDVKTGELIWSGSDSTSVVSFEDSARGLSDDILKAVKSTWPTAAQK